MLAGMAVFLTTLNASLRTQPKSVPTTLYDLIASMQDEIGFEDDAMIVDTVAGLIRAGRLRFYHEIRASRDDG